MSTEFIDMVALNTYSEKSMELVDWILELGDDIYKARFTEEYAQKLQELHKLNKSI